MLSLYLMAVVGLAVEAATNPHDFSRLCSSPAPGGECPAGWRNVDGDCIKFAGWDQAKAQEVCREERAEYTEFVMMREETDSAARHSLPVCLVRRETQCKCGRTNRISIVGGNDVEKNEYPWQVRLSIRTSRSVEMCGGSIISRDKILTAAHCTVLAGGSVERITVFTRDHDRTEEDGEVSHSVCSKREHPEYGREADYDKDIAILTLCKPLMFGKAVGPICLPDPAQDYDNMKALVTGWGRLKSGGQLPDILQEVNVTTMTNQQCREKYGHSRITDNMICAGDVGRDSCQGDSGGPLSVLEQDDRYSQIGIVSWGEGCAKPGYPGVYTRLTSLLDWINQPQKTKYSLCVMEDRDGEECRGLGNQVCNHVISQEGNQTEICIKRSDRRQCESLVSKCKEYDTGICVEEEDICVKEEPICLNMTQRCIQTGDPQCLEFETVCTERGGWAFEKGVWCVTPCGDHCGGASLWSNPCCKAEGGYGWEECQQNHCKKEEQKCAKYGSEPCVRWEDQCNGAKTMQCVEWKRACKTKDKQCVRMEQVCERWASEPDCLQYKIPPPDLICNDEPFKGQCVSICA